MSVLAARNALAPGRRRRLVALGLLRSVTTAVVLVVLYYLLLDHIRSVPLALVGGLLILFLDLLVLGLGIRVFIGAVQLARQQPRPAAGPGIPPR